jgi:hypothetical protein
MGRDPLPSLPSYRPMARGEEELSAIRALALEETMSAHRLDEPKTTVHDGCGGSYDVAHAL